ncbi:glutaredoxin family protein [Hahella sp. CCB-MM4]|uniref:glutaredoxin family protein n=1 Tax=Hahella sp. (strain CCB-MM4) TaxID=1926491 RepID=UPI000B9A84A8|nr:glutaredoxin family protein [Hahella sp. CCB-MM4]OZG74432.1 glutaredoxin family protein [Hahella sp. CCB-MM4]
MKNILLIVIFWGLSCQALGEIYRWVDESGKVHFSDQKPENLSADTIKLEVNTYSSVSYDTSVFDTGRQVVMYSTSWCGYCKKAREYFHANHINYVDYDIENDDSARRRYDQLGAKGVPVILVGNKRMNGFSESGFKRIYSD